MSPVQYLLIPPVALLLALAWTAWANRTRRPAQPTDQVEAYKRAMDAISPDARIP